MSKREAVPKHSLPPQKQILSYMGRFINCPYAPDTDCRGMFLCAYMRQHLPKKPHSSFSREAQSKLQNIVAVPPCGIRLARLGTL